MRTILALITLLIMAGSVSAMTDKEAGYIAGIEDGYELGYMSHSGLGNATAAQMFNDLVGRYNAFLDRIGAEPALKISTMPMPDLSYMPEFLRNYDGTTDPWAGTRVVQNDSRHQIDGGSITYTTNDANTLPEGAKKAWLATEEGKVMGEEYLGGA